MANILDYLDWRGDVPLSVDPFNEVDNLVLSELSYVNFPEIPDAGEPLSLSEASEIYFQKTPFEQFDLESSEGKKMLVMKKIIGNARFGGIRLYRYVNELDKEETIQFSAVTFLLDDGSAYAAFRGTDHSFTGWKESLDISYTSETEGQRKAIDYLNRLSDLSGYSLRVGGHSKGGNYAVYGSAFCDPEIQNRIAAVYSNDGPGFHDSVITSEEYRRILPRVVSIIPDASVIGRLLLNASVPIVVKTTAVGVMQHDAFTWCVKRNRFERTGISGMGEFLDKSINDWTGHLDDGRRESLIESIFTLLEGTGKENFRDLKMEKMKTLRSIMAGLNDLPEDKRQEIIQMVRQLVSSGRQTAFAEFSQFVEKVKAERNSRQSDSAGGNSEKKKKSN